jgi:hypothetical protein
MLGANCALVINARIGSPGMSHALITVNRGSVLFEGAAEDNLTLPGSVY